MQLINSGRAQSTYIEKHRLFNQMLGRRAMRPGGRAHHAATEFSERRAAAVAAIFHKPQRRALVGSPFAKRADPKSDNSYNKEREIEQTRAARQAASDFHNPEKTPNFARSIERSALLQ
jgi:hypothetical protein